VRLEYAAVIERRSDFRGIVHKFGRGDVLREQRTPNNLSNCRGRFGGWRDDLSDTPHANVRRLPHLHLC
jgi:hypothetical protein